MSATRRALEEACSRVNKERGLKDGEVGSWYVEPSAEGRYWYVWIRSAGADHDLDRGVHHRMTWSRCLSFLQGAWWVANAASDAKGGGGR